MKLREAAQQALEALESSRVFVTSREKIKHPEGTEWYDERITALRTALAEPAHKTVPLAEYERLQRLVASQGIRLMEYESEPEQEPVAWQERLARRVKDGAVTEWSGWYECRYRTVEEARAEVCDHIPYEWRPLYTRPPQRKPLTYEQLYALFRRSGLEVYYQRDGVVEMEYERCIERFARAIERAHGIGGEA